MRLVWSSDQEPGIERRRCGRGFTYLDPSGRRIRAGSTRSRIEALAVPPAWTDVWICPTAQGHLQATGRDDQERKQYLYHPTWAELRNVKKFELLLPFSERLPRLRARVASDLEGEGASRTRVTAAAVRVLDSACLRIGNEVYRRTNGTYGLTTLRARHAQLADVEIDFSFDGKGGRRHEVRIRDRELAEALRDCQELPGQSLLAWEDDGEVRRLRSDHVNGYLRVHTGLDATAKIFRLWMGSLHALEHLLQLEPAESQRARTSQFLEAAEVAAEVLNNTRSVCRASYLYPAIEELHVQNRLLETVDFSSARASKWLDREEVALKRLLRRAPVDLPAVNVARP